MIEGEDNKPMKLSVPIEAEREELVEALRACLIVVKERYPWRAKALL